MQSHGKSCKIMEWMKRRKVKRSSSCLLLLFLLANVTKTHFETFIRLQKEMRETTTFPTDMMMQSTRISWHQQHHQQQHAHTIFVLQEQHADLDDEMESNKHDYFRLHSSPEYTCRQKLFTTNAFHVAFSSCFSRINSWISWDKDFRQRETRVSKQGLKARFERKERLTRKAIWVSDTQSLKWQKEMLWNIYGVSREWNETTGVNVVLIQNLLPHLIVYHSVHSVSLCELKKHFPISRQKLLCVLSFKTQVQY